MKKYLILLFLLFAGIATQAQTSKELIGKWKLVKQTKNGVESTPIETYQVFREDGSFLGINGDKSREGRWNLSKDNSKLTVKISVISVKFDILFFDSKRRVIEAPEVGTLEYEKVE